MVVRCFARFVAIARPMLPRPIHPNRNGFSGAGRLAIAKLGVGGERDRFRWRRLNI